MLHDDITAMCDSITLMSLGGGGGRLHLPMMMMKPLPLRARQRTDGCWEKKRTGEAM